MAAIDDALDGLPARELERLRARIDKRLQSCFHCGNDGATPVSASVRHGTQKGSRMTFLMCPACIERHRLPESRAEDPT